jgi:hypothetical protein
MINVPLTDRLGFGKMMILGSIISLPVLFVHTEYHRFRLPNNRLCAAGTCAAFPSLRPFVRS